MGTANATTGAGLVEDKIETDTKFVREMLEKIENAENKGWGFMARIMISVEKEGGIDKIKEKLINDKKIDLMDFEESELVFSAINDDGDEDGNSYYDSVKIVFTLPNTYENILYLKVLELFDLRKELYLKYINYEKMIGVQQNEKNK